MFFHVNLKIEGFQSERQQVFICDISIAVWESPIQEETQTVFWLEGKGDGYL